jgi:hypothetical protein
VKTIADFRKTPEVVSPSSFAGNQRQFLQPDDVTSGCWVEERCKINFADGPQS